MLEYIILSELPPLRLAKLQNRKLNYRPETVQQALRLTVVRWAAHHIEHLPANADAGSVLKVEIEANELVAIEVIDEQTEKRRKANQERFDRLSKRLSDSDSG